MAGCCPPAGSPTSISQRNRPAFEHATRRFGLTRFDRSLSDEARVRGPLVAQTSIARRPARDTTPRTSAAILGPLTSNRRRQALWLTPIREARVTPPAATRWP